VPFFSVENNDEKNPAMVSNEKKVVSSFCGANLI